ncbi:MXAN_6640 family putative metalloprotease [Bacteroidota bacterium]
MNKYILVFTLFVLVAPRIYAQNLDSLYNVFLHARTGLSDPKVEPILSSDDKIKCGFALVNELKRNLNYFSGKQRIMLNSLLSRPVTETSIVTPGGHFRIHYDTSGPHAPVYDINELAASFDTVYNFEIEQLGYPPPPSDDNRGGDELYDVYIQSLSRGFYGYTETETDLPGNRHTTFTVMENAYENYYSAGIFGAKVTAAHEFHHAIQLGNYIYRPNDLFYYEITSTSMEEFIFDYINDYYDYLEFYFNYPEKTFSTRNTGLDGYDLAIWNIYLKDRFGYDVIKDIWELMSENRALIAMANVFEEYGTSFKYELNNFGLWTYFTSDRSKSNEYFEEAENYPLINPLGVYDYTPPGSMPVIVNSEPVSNNFLIYIDDTNGSSDTLVAIITNGDVNSGIHTYLPTLEFEHQIVSDYQSGAVRINDSYYSSITSPHEDMIEASFVFNNEPISGGSATSEDEFAFPQPFNYANSTHDFIRIPAANNQTGSANLNIYSVSMNLVYSGVVDIYGVSKYYVRWDGFNQADEKLSTGIYIYVTESDGVIKKGKIVIFNE